MSGDRFLHLGTGAGEQSRHVCGQRDSEGWMCTLVWRHSGRHESIDTDGVVKASWWDGRTPLAPPSVYDLLSDLRRAVDHQPRAMVLCDLIGHVIRCGVDDDVEREGARMADERRRLADLLREHAETIGAFASSPASAVSLTAMLIELAS